MEKARKIWVATSMEALFAHNGPMEAVCGLFTSIPPKEESAAWESQAAMDACVAEIINDFGYRAYVNDEDKDPECVVVRTGTSGRLVSLRRLTNCVAVLLVDFGENGSHWAAEDILSKGHNWEVETVSGRLITAAEFLEETPVPSR